MKYLRVPQNNVSSNDSEGYAALQDGVALVDRPERTIFRLTGKDPGGMLNAILTNDIPREENRGAYALLLNPKGRVQADLRVVKMSDEVLVDTEREGAAAAEEILGRYAPFSRVKLERLPDWGVLGLYGPRAAGLLGDRDPAEHEMARTEIDGTQVLIVGVTVPVGGYDLIGPVASIRTVREYLTGAIPASQAAYETARIAAGAPRFGTDITPDNFPGESESVLERSVSFGKGCYPGQETVARMHYRGSPNKKLYRFELEPGPAGTPEPGDDILQGENGPVGRITSVAPLFVESKTYALGYLARKADLEAPMGAEAAKVLAISPA